MINGVVKYQYDYDSNGNRLVGIVNGELFNGEYDSQDRLKSYGDMVFSYNKNGELITKEVGTDLSLMDYDVFGNLIQYRKNCDENDECEQEIDYKYDPLGRKIGRIYQNGNTIESERWYIYGDQLNPILELDQNGMILAQFVYGVNSNTPEYMIKDGKKYKIISDHLGSVRKVIDFDTKEVVQEIKYDSFGNILEDSNVQLLHPNADCDRLELDGQLFADFQPFGYVGGLQDRETGYVNFGAREYDPKTGRWTSKEPLGFDGSMNFYGYCEGDPVNFVDVSGLKFNLKNHSTLNEIELQNMLNEIASVDLRLQKMIEELENSDYEIVIINEKGLFKSNECSVPYNIEDKNYIFINFNNKNIQGDEVIMTSLEILAHELTHALQLLRYISPANLYELEKEPIDNQNIIREYQGNSERKKYGNVNY